MSDGLDRSDPLWYKDAVIYQVHVKSYYDSNSDGYGDIPGLIEKLDYIQDLGVNCIWMLPFYPSPLRDDGYDIADYEGINPIYGNIEDFKRLITEAHARGIRVITELVINHTSDQHPWFQLARRSPPGSPERNFYVWSDTDDKYPDVRIIFTDTETSNWTWDPMAKAYYWHRFFHHQPDLNFDNPDVFNAVTKVMNEWLAMGVDGLRLDAIPYLVERDGTNCENLPETHKVLKDMRAVLDKNFSDKIFLAEANQWPTDVREYFGNGDECHMAFHFPVMPRLFMAVHLEDRHPISDILRQTPEIPENCQWAMFLRNHDELTLEMVTDVERDYMYKAYAKNPLMKINVGIRRRLAPLLEHSRPRIELLNSLLFSLPGTPIVYYGDEIGMGENIYLSDRNGVRTPMHWSPDRNAGFSKAQFAQLYSPPIMDPISGFQSVNVESQQLDPSSLLNWMKSIIKLRQKHKVFGRGSTEVLSPENRKVFAYIRKYEDETILCVCNLSRYPQSVSLDLGQYENVTPVEMFGLGGFHPIGKDPYVLTFGPYAFYWLMLSFSKESMPSPAPADLQECKTTELVSESRDMVPLLSLNADPTWEAVLTGDARKSLENELLPAYVSKQRWYGRKSEGVKSVKILDHTVFPTSEGSAAAFFSEVQSTNDHKDFYMLYLMIGPRPQTTEVTLLGPDKLVGEVACTSGTCTIYDALSNEEFCLNLLELVSSTQRISTKNGTMFGGITSAHDSVVTEQARTSVKVVSSEQSNTSIVFGNEAILKLYRRVQPGINPDYEMGVYLCEQTNFKNTPRVAGSLSYQRKKENQSFTIALLQQYVANQGDGWSHTVSEFRRYYERAITHQHLFSSLETEGKQLKDLVQTEIPRAAIDLLGIYLTEAETLGKRTGEMHVALAAETSDHNFKPDTVNKDELRALTEDIKRLLGSTLTALNSRSQALSEPVKKLADELGRHKPDLISLCERLNSDRGELKAIRCHGDYHLGQVLNVFGDWYILDFEGEPSRSLEERIHKQSALKDVAGMLRSFSYAAYASLFLFTHNRPEDLRQFYPWAKAAETWSSVAFLQGYLTTTHGHDLVPNDLEEFFRVLMPFVVDKALYELDYELNNRPDWLGIPLFGIVNELRAGVLK